MDDQSDLERLQAALEELLRITAEARLTALFRMMANVVILHGSDTLLAAMSEMVSYLDKPPVEVGHGETLPEGHDGAAANIAATIAWLEKPTPPPHPGGRSFDR